jgi:hypothetical protein
MTKQVWHQCDNGKSHKSDIGRNLRIHVTTSKSTWTFEDERARVDIDSNYNMIREAYAPNSYRSC